METIDILFQTCTTISGNLAFKQERLLSDAGPWRHFTANGCSVILYVGNRWEATGGGDHVFISVVKSACNSPTVE